RLVKRPGLRCEAIEGLIEPRFVKFLKLEDQVDIVSAAESAGSGIPQPDQPPEIGAIRLRKRGHGTPGPMPQIAVRLVPQELLELAAPQRLSVQIQLKGCDPFLEPIFERIDLRHIVHGRSLEAVAPDLEPPGEKRFRFPVDGLQPAVYQPAIRRICENTR